MQTIKKIDKKKLESALEKLSKRPDAVGQPAMVYSCFLNSGYERIEDCDGCRHYMKCEQYLKFFKE